MSISIGEFSLDGENFSAISNVTFEYFTAESGEIIGGHTIATITGTVSIPDEDGSAITGAIVMKTLKGIRDLGKQTKCISVSIPNFSPNNGQAKITSLTIDEGPDSSWVNQGAFTIELKGLLNEIPPNSFNIVASDGVTELSRSESIEIGEDSHDFVYTSTASKAFVKFSNQLSLRCEPYCSNVSPLAVLQKVIRIGPTKSVLSEYAGWTQYLQSRSFSINTDGSISFSCDLVLTPPGAGAGALVDLEFSYSRNYSDKKITYITSGTVNGLAPVSWGDIANLSDTCSASKFSSALSVYSDIHGTYSDLGAWDGITMELEEKPNCPKKEEKKIGRCSVEDEDDEDDKDGGIKPTSSRVSLSRTEGSINFSFEWSTDQSEDGTCVVEGVRKETTVDITERQPNFVEHILPRFGTLLQDINCRSAKRISVAVSVTYPESECGKDKNAECEANDGLDIVLKEYFGSDNYLLIGHKITETNNSYIVKEDYIECRR